MLVVPFAFAVVVFPLMWAYYTIKAAAQRRKQQLWYAEWRREQARKSPDDWVWCLEGELARKSRGYQK